MHAEGVSTLLDVPTLSGHLVALEPLSESHVDDLTAAAAEGRASYGFTFVPQGREAMAGFVEELLTARAVGTDVPFAQLRLADAAAVGVTRFLTLRRRPLELIPYAVEIGGTWLAASAQQSGINAEAKLLLLSHAFERWRVGRVDLKTDARDERSRGAILALGAHFEGVLRNWQPSQAPGEEGELRDSAIYSILDLEWPAVRDALSSRVGERLNRGGRSPSS